MKRRANGTTTEKTPCTQYGCVLPSVHQLSQYIYQHMIIIIVSFLSLFIHLAVSSVGWLAAFSCLARTHTAYDCIHSEVENGVGHNKRRSDCAETHLKNTSWQRNEKRSPVCVSMHKHTLVKNSSLRTWSVCNLINMVNDKM